MNEFKNKLESWWTLKLIRLSSSCNKTFTCGFKKYSHSIFIYFKMGKHHMRCLKIKCIETFLIEKIKFKKFNISLSSFIDPFVFKIMFLHEFFDQVYV
jgi:hypothetical protein